MKHLEDVMLFGCQCGSTVIKVWDWQVAHGYGGTLAWTACIDGIDVGCPFTFGAIRGKKV